MKNNRDLTKAILELADRAGSGETITKQTLLDAVGVVAPIDLLEPDGINLIERIASEVAVAINDSDETRASDFGYEVDGAIATIADGDEKYVICIRGRCSDGDVDSAYYDIQLNSEVILQILAHLGWEQIVRIAVDTILERIIGQILDNDWLLEFAAYTTGAELVWAAEQAGLRAVTNPHSLRPDGRDSVAVLIDKTAGRATIVKCFSHHDGTTETVKARMADWQEELFYAYAAEKFKMNGKKRVKKKK